jgi:hypothetical protein
VRWEHSSALDHLCEGMILAQLLIFMSARHASLQLDCLNSLCSPKAQVFGSNSGTFFSGPRPFFAACAIQTYRQDATQVMRAID